MNHADAPSSQIRNAEGSPQWKNDLCLAKPKAEIKARARDRIRDLKKQLKKLKVDSWREQKGSFDILERADLIEARIDELHNLLRRARI